MLQFKKCPTESGWTIDQSIKMRFYGHLNDSRKITLELISLNFAVYNVQGFVHEKIKLRSNVMVQGGMNLRPVQASLLSDAGESIYGKVSFSTNNDCNNPRPDWKNRFRNTHKVIGRYTV
jgi:hypothetical protein